MSQAYFNIRNIICLLITHPDLDFSAQDVIVIQIKLVFFNTLLHTSLETNHFLFSSDVFISSFSSLDLIERNNAP